ncbi:Tafazzin family protein [Lachancea thermotolerans]|uniref:Tafazzin family protein n=1 Tax=Lachancea thermotolerans (strain ATCC 56472 / CBS 6340 / NRRL Y-8284) TaxID=559295 RepID=C5DJ90_LACTC|nr:KLTH0F14476p [Lachancea thermotolerans CBS 6340]CAR24379.1 KLTH0F14476p [Lachancea thermotolerans CBS 6340]
MSLPDVLNRGDEFLSEYPRRSRLWQIGSHATCLLTVGISKLVLKTCYNTQLNHFEKLESAIERSVSENRGLMTVMNHMSVVDDPFIWGVFPWRMYRDLDHIRWCLGAHNVCFQSKFLATFFSLGKVLSTERFGAGPFQGSIDASIRLLSPDDTLDLEWTPHHVDCPEPLRSPPLVQKITKEYIPPVARTKPSWVHVYPEGFVLQLHPPYANSMRYFKWGITRMVLESTKAPIVVPIFTTGFEKIAPESAAGTKIERYLPRNFGAEVNVTVGDPVNDSIIERYREEWRRLVEKYHDPQNPTDLTQELKTGTEAQALRSKLAAELRKHVAQIRHDQRGFPQEDEKFQSPKWWKLYTQTEGSSDPSVEFIGKNWAIRRLQKFLREQEENGDLEKNGPNSKK